MSFSQQVEEAYAAIIGLRQLCVDNRVDPGRVCMCLGGFRIREHGRCTKKSKAHKLVRFCPAVARHIFAYRKRLLRAVS